MGDGLRGVAVTLTTGDRSGTVESGPRALNDALIKELGKEGRLFLSPSIDSSASEPHRSSLGSHLPPATATGNIVHVIDETLAFELASPQLQNKRTKWRRKQLRASTTLPRARTRKPKRARLLRNFTPRRTASAPSVRYAPSPAARTQSTGLDGGGPTPRFNCAV
ncbi:hypothetical protein AAFF_G00345800 [Aldrovandia affinis]|uniref:Uncharacterized protein n=1 Tax=Aldrovandia affinis TaxID=143900 RepID=A0AAD7SJD3_9TELE|nr:hypothetical protein AAFF_G00345800 [Aldrovandia affinis]